MRLSLSVYGGLAVAMLSLAPNAHATMITYEMTGVASGTIGTTTFTNATVEFIGTGDTANVSSFSTMLSTGTTTVFGNPLETFTVTIGGVGTATITNQSALWAIPLGAVLFGREDHVGGVPVLDSITGLALNLVGGYESTTAIGPVTNSGAIGFPACGGTGEDPCVATTLGLLSFTSNINDPLTTTLTTQTTFTAIGGVPEPSSYWELLTALLGLAAIRTRVKSQVPKIR